METIGKAAQRLLGRLERAANARKDGSERRKGSEELKKPTGSAGDARPVGNTRARGTHGLENDAGEVLGLRDPEFATIHSPATNADLNRYDFTDAELTLRFSGQRFGDARWFGIRSRPHRPEGCKARPRAFGLPAVGANDNVHPILPMVNRTPLNGAQV